MEFENKLDRFICIDDFELAMILIAKHPKSLYGFVTMERDRTWIFILSLDLDMDIRMYEHNLREKADE